MRVQEEIMENLERPGYRFDGWYVDEARTKRINPGGRLPSSVTLYDKWTPIPFAVKYSLDGGENSSQNPQFITVESGLKKLYPAHRTGSCFKGWKWNGKMVDYLPEGIHEEVLLEAVYGKRPVISFETFEGARISERETNDYGQLDQFRPPMRMGYDFTGWYYDPELIHPVSDTQVFREDTRLYAGWKKSVYTIAYDAQGGIFTDEPAESFSFDTPTWFLSRPVRPGYIFKGWKDSRGRILRSIMKGSMGNRVLSAVWEKDSPEVHGMGETPEPLDLQISEEEPAAESVPETETGSGDIQLTQNTERPAEDSPESRPELTQAIQNEEEMRPQRAVLSRSARRQAAPDRN